jgi:hypothetical protein
MPSTLQFRRAANITATTIIGANGELFINSDKQTLAIHDGATPGGFPLASQKDILYNSIVDAEQNTKIGLAYNQANTGTVLAQAAYHTANSSLSAFGVANTGLVLAQAAFNSANNVSPQVQPAFNVANTGLILAQAGFNQANTGTVLAQAAYNQANNSSLGGFSANTIIIANTSGYLTSNTSLNYFSANATLKTSNVFASNVTSNVIVDFIGNIRNVPAQSKSGSYTILQSDSGQFLTMTSSFASINLSYNIYTSGSIFTVFNNSSNSQTISVGSNSVIFAGSGSTGNRTLASYGLCTIIFTSPTAAVISGTGLA